MPWQDVTAYTCLVGRQEQKGGDTAEQGSSTLLRSAATAGSEDTRSSSRVDDKHMPSFTDDHVHPEACRERGEEEQQQATADA
jgi:hypothetical protein